MPCSKCKKDGHNRATCVEPEVPVVEHVQSKQKSKPVDEVIDIPEEDRIKFRKLAALCSEVAKTLGKGHTESVYQHALCMELQTHGIAYSFEVPMSIMYKGHTIPHNYQRLDVIIYDYLPFIFEFKANNCAIKNCDRWQLVRYMGSLDKPYGAVVNFTQKSGRPLLISVIVRHEGVYKKYNVASGKGRPLVDYGYSASLTDDDCDSDTSDD